MRVASSPLQETSMRRGILSGAAAQSFTHDLGMNRMHFALLGVGLVVSAGAWSEEPAAEERLAPPDHLIVMAWNIHHGEGEDGRLDLERIADIIKISGADIVLLQEVDDRTQRTGRVPQAAELARLTGLKATFGKAMDFQGGGYGNAVLTRWAPVETRVVPLPGGGEPRCALEVTVDTPETGGRLSVVSTHLDVSSAGSAPPMPNNWPPSFSRSRTWFFWEAILMPLRKSHRWPPSPVRG
jgi:hypothetical protein